MKAEDRAERLVKALCSEMAEQFGWKMNVQQIKRLLISAIEQAERDVHDYYSEEARKRTRFE